MRSPVNHVLPLAALLLVGGTALAKPAAPQPASGPAADYPVVLGESFTVGTQTYTPADKLNYDEVGQATIAADAGERISAAHKTLPLPSYVEVTSLESGRTILVRIERRGPMSNETLIELSPGAAAQLGLTDRTAVRVRRVNPPEPERALIRAGQRAPERMATPKGLLDALNRKLQQQSPAALAQKPAAPVPPVREPTKAPAVAKPAAVPAPITAQTAPAPRATPTPSAKSTPAPAPKPAPAANSLIVQVAALSTRQRADAAAAKLGASVSPAGRLWRIRLGPFTSRTAAEAALAKARGAGYSDARIQRAD